MKFNTVEEEFTQTKKQINAKTIMIQESLDKLGSRLVKNLQ
jgi:hypothetical protein